MRKIWTIGWKDIYLTFTDRTLIVILIITPLMISCIVALVFGGDDGGISLSDIPVAIVNIDEGIVQQGAPLNYGDTLVGLLIPEKAGDRAFDDSEPCPEGKTGGGSSDEGSSYSLDKLVDAVELDDAEVARAAVRGGD